MSDSGTETSAQQSTATASVDLEAVLSQLVIEAVVAEFPEAPPGIDASVRPSKFADYQVNCALSLAKPLRSAPRAIAEAIAGRLRAHPEILSRVEVAGPGFLNCTFNNDFLAEGLHLQVRDARLGRPLRRVPLRVVIDYASPNVAKEMHVGHLRSTVVGDALARLLTSTGDTVIRQNHLGDWGTQFGMLIEHVLETDSENNSSSSPDGHIHIADLEQLYREARAHFDADDGFKERARARVVALQSGDAETLRLWHMLVDESKRHFDETFERLRTLLVDDDYRGESMYNDMLDDTVAELEKRGLLREDDGALCAFPEGFLNPEGRPFPLIVRKSNGGYGYAATDLAALRYNVENDRSDLVLYVTDGRQAQHFAMVIAVARDAGWLEHTRAEHVPFGMVLGADGRPFKTREGGTVRLADLLDDSVAKAKALLDQRGADLPPDELEEIASAVGIGAIKWMDLKNDRTQNYVFDLETMTSLNGNTGPYIQYAATRARSVLRRAGVPLESGFAVTEDAERSLALGLLAYGNAVRLAVETFEPHHICSYLYELAGRFSYFYEHCPILKAPTDELRDTRLALCNLAGRVLSDGLELLGITPLERM